MSTAADILHEFRSLPSDERLALLDELWLAATAEVALSQVSDAERAFVEMRLEDADRHQSQERDWAEVRDELYRRT